MDDQRFIVFSAGRDCRRYVGKHVNSIRKQGYPHFVHVVIDDVSGDGTYEVLKENKHSKMFLHRNEKNMQWVRNAVEYLPQYIKNDEDVIIVVDMDDWLANEKVLSILNSVYRKKDCWMTCGSFMLRKPGNYIVNPFVDHHGIGQSTTFKYYSKAVVRNRTFREAPWMWWHPKTFKAFLWRAIKVEDLYAPNGKFPLFTYDKAIGFPMLEMTPPGKMIFVKDLLYIYNVENPKRSKKTLKDHGGLGRWYREKEPYEVLKRV